MTATQTICLTVLLCWQSLMAVIWYAVSKHKGTSVKKTVEVDVK